MIKDTYDIFGEGYKLDKLKEKEKKSKLTIDKEGTGKILERIILASFDAMTIKQLVNVRYYLNNKIKMKKIMKRIHQKGLTIPEKTNLEMGELEQE